MARTEPRLSDKELMERTLRDMPAFAAWSSLSMSRLLAISRLQWHARGDSLSDKDRAPEILVLVSGSVLYVEPSIRDIDLRAPWTLLGTGLLLGLPHMLALEKRLFEYIASDDVVAIHIDGNLLFELLDSDATRWKDMGYMLISQALKLGDLASSQMAGRLSRRLAETLEKLAESQGTRSSESHSIHLRVTQRDLAAILQVSRQSVSKELAGLSVSGVIEVKYNAIVVLDPIALRKIARPPAVQQAARAAPHAVGTRENSAKDIAIMEKTLRSKQACLPWSAAAMARLLGSSRLERHPKGSVVWTSLGGVEEYLLVVSGHASIGRVSPEGERFVLILFGPGDFSHIKPTNSLNLHRDYGSYDCIAETEVMTIHMPMTLILETLDSEPMLWKEALLMSERLQESYTQTVYRQVTGSLRERLASTIQRLAKLHGVRAEREGATLLKISQTSLALLLQANRQAVNKELKALAASGAVALGYNGVTVLDDEALGRNANRSREI